LILVASFDQVTPAGIARRKLTSVNSWNPLLVAGYRSAARLILAAAYLGIPQICGQTAQPSNINVCPVNQKQLLAAAVRTLRAGIILKNPPGERRDHLLARLEVLIEQSRRQQLHE